MPPTNSSQSRVTTPLIFIAVAALLTYIDGIDSRMEIYREQLPNVKLGEFSGRVFALDGGMIYRHF